MTVSELIDQLKKFPPKARVLVNGYEGGFSDPDPARVKKIHLDSQTGADYEGPHTECGKEDRFRYGPGEDCFDCEANRGLLRKCVVIER